MKVKSHLLWAVPWTTAPKPEHLEQPLNEVSSQTPLVSWPVFCDSVSINTRDDFCNIHNKVMLIKRVIFYFPMHWLCITQLFPFLLIGNTRSMESKENGKRELHWFITILLNPFKHTSAPLLIWCKFYQPSRTPAELHLNKDCVKEAVRVLMREKGGKDSLLSLQRQLLAGKENVEKSPYLNLKVSPSSTALPGVISKIPLKG